MFGFVDGVKSVNGAEIIARDIQASNGVIHVIDSVILPPDVAALLPSADVSPAAEEEAAATETPAAEEEAAPETLPVTGSTYGASPWIVLALVVAAALTLMVRRRMI